CKRMRADRYQTDLRCSFFRSPPRQKTAIFPANFSWQGKYRRFTHLKCCNCLQCIIFFLSQLEEKVLVEAVSCGSGFYPFCTFWWKRDCFRCHTPEREPRFVTGARDTNAGQLATCDPRYPVTR